MKTIIIIFLTAILLLSVLLNAGQATGWVRIGNPEHGYTVEQRIAMDELAAALEDAK